MCLTVTHIPSSQRTRLITPSHKMLELRGFYIVTPFTGYKIPNNGWLFPKIQYKGSFYLGSKIRGGLIHAFARRSPLEVQNDCLSYPLFTAYSFCVEAFEINSARYSQLVSRALYIPDADGTDANEQTLDIIESLPYNLTKSLLLKRLPILKRIERYL